MRRLTYGKILALLILALIGVGIMSGCAIKDSRYSYGDNNDDSGTKFVCSYSGKCGLGYDYGNGMVTHYGTGSTGLGFGF